MLKPLTHTFSPSLCRANTLLHNMVDGCPTWGAAKQLFRTEVAGVQAAGGDDYIEAIRYITGVSPRNLRRRS